MIRWLNASAGILGLLSLGLGLFVLAGWALDIMVLKSVLPGLETMKANTAGAFLVAGIAVWAVATMGAPRITTLMGALVALLASATLLQDVLGFDLGIDELLFTDDADQVGGGAPGRMSPATAIGFTLTGLAIMLLASRRLVMLSQLLATLGASVGLIALIGYLFQVESLYAIESYTAMALHTSIGLLLLNIGVLLARPTLGFIPAVANNLSGAIVARRLLPLAILLPVGLAGLLLAGQEAALIDSPFAIILASVASGLVLLALIWWTAHSVERKERELRSQRRYLETTLRSIGDAVIVTTPRGYVSFMNFEAERLTGWSRAEAEGRALDEVFEIVDEVTRERVEGPVEKTLRLGQVVGLANHTILVSRTGEEWPIDDSAAPVRDDADNLLGVVLVFRDVTERRRQEAALVASERRFRATFEAAPVGIAHVGLDGTWRLFNDTICRITGYDRDELSSLTFTDITHPDDIEEDWRQAKLVSSGELERYSMEKRYVRKDGTTVWVDLGVSMLRDEQGQPVCFISSVQDISERKAAEAAIAEKTQQLETEDRRKDMFLATLGHELRNPLAALSSAALLLQMKHADTSRLHGIITRQVDQLTKLVNDLLEVARVTRGKVELSKTTVELPSLIRAATESVSAQIQDKGQTLRLDLPERFQIEGDPDRLEQIFTNLVTNASKYTPEGGQIDVTLARCDDEAIVRVRDTGRGIGADQLEHIFEPFVQENSGDGGLGIGLSLVRSLVELHEGSVSAASAGIGKGAEFTCRLPIGSPTESLASPGFIEPGPLRPDVKVLVIDDLPDAAETLRLVLESLGAQVRCAYSGREGLEIARQWLPDSALVDIGLPDITGYDLAATLRAEHSDMQLLAVTGFGDESAAAKARQAGFDARLVKPVDYHALRALLMERLESRGAPADPRHAL